ncbi:MAG TPA: excinuclease ABC subunit UvrB [Candidatus Dormibacteraeota bacterium]|nr:excinuclease ABC subunit UvrB [Candidatus Dormibacteraeota bacterium]
MLLWFDDGGTLVPLRTTIGELVDRALERRVDGLASNGTELHRPDRPVYTVSLDPRTFAVEMKPITWLIRHRAPSEMYRVRTTCGRTVTVTGDHSLYVLRSGRLELLPGSEVRPGDFLPVPRMVAGRVAPAAGVAVAAAREHAAPGWSAGQVALRESLSAGARTLPRGWERADEADLSAALERLFERCGTVDAHAASFLLTGAEAAGDVALALLRFGIHGKIARVWLRRHDAPDGYRWYWRCSISGHGDLAGFAAHVGLRRPDQRELLSRAVRAGLAGDTDFVPLTPRQLRQVRESVKLRMRDLARAAGLTSRLLSLIERDEQMPTAEQLLRIAEALVRYVRETPLDEARRDGALAAVEHWRGLCRPRWAAVAGVEELDEYQAPYVYDVSVADNQTFLAGTGGLIVHNTMAMAAVVDEVQKPTLVLCHNKTLAAQLCAEFKEFFPNNAVEYFVSYFDYYQPEAYIAHTDTYIEKDSSINDEIERLRHSATQAVLTRPDTLIVASVSCIYGLGSPADYQELSCRIRVGEEWDRDTLLRKLVDMQYRRNDLNLVRGNFRARGDTLEFVAVDEELVHRIEFWGDEISAINVVNQLTGEYVESKDELLIFPAKHFITPEEKMQRAIRSIEQELQERLTWFRSQGKLLEAQRLEMRTNYDLDMLREVGYCNGIENYSRHLTGREPGSTPWCLLDFFPKDWLLFVDESHVTLPQVRGMYGGDRSRKESLVEHGFRLPSALDNRPLFFEEFEQHLNQVVYVSATPGSYELGKSEQVAEMIVRPTGLVDPEVEVRPTRNQVDDLMEEIRARAARNERVLVTTLTKKMAEDLTDFLLEMGFRVRYMHAEVETLERIAILRDLRLGEFDVLVGINLLREGLDLPEVSLVAILDADKEGYLRSATSLIQTIGRAARNVEGKVIMYADVITESMAKAIDETKRRREMQIAFNKEHGIEPRTVRKQIRDILAKVGAPAEGAAQAVKADRLPRDMALAMAKELEQQMKQAAANLEFEKAAALRDELVELRKQIGGNESVLFQGKAPKIFESSLTELLR